MMEFYLPKTPFGVCRRSTCGKISSSRYVERRRPRSRVHRFSQQTLAEFKVGAHKGKFRPPLSKPGCRFAFDDLIQGRQQSPDRINRDRGARRAKRTHLPDVRVGDSVGETRVKLKRSPFSAEAFGMYGHPG